jgi:hypothetical protein
VVALLCCSQLSLKTVSGQLEVALPASAITPTQTTMANQPACTKEIMWKTLISGSLYAFKKFGYENEGTRTLLLKVSFAAGFGVGVVFLEGRPLP